MRQAAVFVDAKGNASRVPGRGVRKSERYQLDGARLDLIFGNSAASSLGDCIRFVRRTRSEQFANFACGNRLRQSGAGHVTH
ncbi:hypothetical protein F8237_05980 [Bradyrhizobium betae]|uniref:Uncharacterized protein n=1 Tax=Bradyrhizobium betae TaxID=244734 RepID=A0A5P6P0S6_9BRAD|nr:hypothetical protein F8237_05980 [Bradyrhizobium betae]